MKLYVIVVFFYFFGCTSISFDPICTDKKNDILLYQEVLIDIPVDGTSYDFVDIDYNTTEGLLYCLDSYSNKISVCDLLSKKVSNIISLQSSGPDEIVDVYSLYVINSDSIYLMSIDYYSTLSLVNAGGKVLNRWRINYELPEGISTVTGEYFLSGIGQLDEVFKVEGDTLIAAIGYGGLGDDHYTRNYKKPLLAFVSLKNQKIQKVTFDLPQIYNTAESIPHDDGVRFDKVGESEWVVGYESIGLVYFSAFDQYYCVQSNYDTGKRTLFERGLPHEYDVYIDSFKFDDRYEGLHHDSVLGVTYRIFKQGDTRGERGREEAYWSVIAIDNNGKVIGETALFTEPIYDFNFIDVIPGEGLLVSRENFMNPNNNEEVLSFSLFTFDLDQK